MGFGHRVLTEAYSISAIDKALTDASVKAMLIDRIDSDHLADARKHLQLELDADIFTVDVLLGSADDRTRDLAQKALRVSLATGKRTPRNKSLRAGKRTLT